MEEKVFIQNRHGLKMAIKLNWSPERNKLVFLEHGLGARKEYPHMKVLEEVFAANGYNVVNIDATNSLNESENSKDSFTFTGHYQDLEDAINWAKSQPFYTEPFALAGQSVGAIASVLYSRKYPQKVNFLVLASLPWLNGKIDVAQNKRTKTILEKGYYEQISKSTGRVLRIYKNYLDDMEKYDLTDAIKNITADTSVIVGLLDTEYHIDNCKKLYEMLNCKKELFLLPNVPHDLANTPETYALFKETLQNILSKQNQIQ